MKEDERWIEILKMWIWKKTSEVSWSEHRNVEKWFGVNKNRRNMIILKPCLISINMEAILHNIDAKNIWHEILNLI